MCGSKDSNTDDEQSKTLLQNQFRSISSILSRNAMIDDNISDADTRFSIVFINTKNICGK